MVRFPQVAGSFYSAESQKLQEQIRGCFLDDLGPKKIGSQISEDKTKILQGIIVPHAGYMYSGPIASWAYQKITEMAQPPKAIILIGPNHSSRGDAVSIYPDGAWQTPLGKIAVNAALSKKLAEEGFALDPLAHDAEHSLEVQIPFLQFVLGSAQFRIVAITLLDQSLDTVLKLSKSLAKILQAEKDFLIIGTTDLTHYETEAEAHAKDSQLLEALQAGNIANIYETAAEVKSSACGIGPASTVIEICSILGAQKIDLLKYETSAAVTGDKQAVVGYAALSINYENSSH